MKESSGVTFKSLVGVEEEPGKKAELPAPIHAKKAETRERPIAKPPRPTKPTKKPVQRKRGKTKKKSRKNREKKTKSPKSLKLDDNSLESGVTFKAWVGVKMSSSDVILREVSESSRRKSKSVQSRLRPPRPRPGRRRSKGGNSSAGGRRRTSQRPRSRSRHPRRRGHDQ